MSPQHHRRPIGAALVVAATIILAQGCGGGGGSSNPSPPSPPSPPALSITTNSLPDGIAGQAYSATLQASGGTPPYTWRLGTAYGPLPLGLVLGTDGVISGTPTFGASSIILVEVRDSVNRFASRSFTLRVGTPLQFTSLTLANGNVGIPYSGFLGLSGGLPPYTWSLAAGSSPLPGGLSLGSASGILFGTPTGPGTFNFTIEVRDSAVPQPQVVSANVSLVIENQLFITTNQLPEGVVSRPYSATLQAVGGTVPYTWSLDPSSAPLPAGLTLSSSGQISGTPSQQASWAVTFKVTDSSAPPQSVSQFQYILIQPVVSIQTTILADGARDVAYSGDVLITGGLLPYSARIVAGSLPPGLSLAPASPFSQNVLFLNGVPSALGTFNFRLEIADASNPPLTDQQDLSVRVNQRLFLTTSSLPSALTGDAYNFTLTGSGGLPPYLWTSGPLPAGLTLNSASGQITGVPTQEFNDSVFIVLQDAARPPQLVSNSFSLKIVGRLAVTTTRLPNAQVAAPLSMTLTVSGGTPPFMWSVSSGSLPAGLTLNTGTGEISGTPSAVGTSSFTVRVTDSGSGALAQAVTRTLGLNILAAAALGRNDSIATATALSNGTYRASISPFADPPTGAAAPDTDYYLLAANGGAVVAVKITAENLAPPSPLDSVIEIVDASGTRLLTCQPVFGGGFASPCMNDDDLVASTLDSRLEFQVPGAPATPVNFYVRVIDFRGDARPDLVYTIKISGAN